jgi:hypothetical protein
MRSGWTFAVRPAARMWGIVRELAASGLASDFERAEDRVVAACLAQMATM